MYLILWPLNQNHNSYNCISHEVFAIEQSKQELIFVNELNKQISNSMWNLFHTLNWSDLIFRKPTS